MEIPEICTDQEKQILDFIQSRLELFEPVSVIGLRGLGKNVILNNINTSFLERRGYRLEKIIASNEGELNVFINKVTEFQGPVLALISLSLGKDGEQYLSDLSVLREKRSTKFIPVILSDIKSVFSSYKNKEKIVTRSLAFLKPLGFSDTQALASSISKRVGLKLSGDEVNKIFKYTNGHLGLIKSLILLIKDTGRIPSLDSFSANPSILTRLEEIKNDLPLNITKKISSNSHFSENEFNLLNELGLIKSNKIVITAFSYFMQNTKEGLEVDLSTLTKNEISLFNLFKSAVNGIVGREEIAKTIWKDNWEDRYSEWAIDQNISRLREKLKINKSNFEINTKKGLGFILQEK